MIWHTRYRRVHRTTPRQPGMRSHC